MRIHSFLLNFAQKRNKIIQQWTLENLFERLKATIMRNDFLRTIIIIGLIALACLIIYTVGKCMGHRTKRFFQWSGKMGERL